MIMCDWKEQNYLSDEREIITCYRPVLWITSGGERHYCNKHADMLTVKGQAFLRHLGDGAPFLEEAPRTIMVTDKVTEGAITVEIWDECAGVPVVLFTPNDDRCVLLEKDEVERLAEHLKNYLMEVERD